MAKKYRLIKNKYAHLAGTLQDFVEEMAFDPELVDVWAVFTEALAFESFEICENFV